MDPLAPSDGEAWYVPQRQVPASVRQAGGSARLTFFATPLIFEVSICDRPVLPLSWWNLGHTLGPYCGGGGGGLVSLTSMITWTVALPAVPASTSTCCVRMPTNGCGATGTVAKTLPFACTVPG